MRQYLCAIAALALLIAIPTFGQVTPAAGSTPPDDTPSVKVGGTIFADYTYTETPKSQDAAKNTINANAFNVSRAYLNITGNINHMISFRITPDIARETGSGASLAGSNEFRLKYAFGQLNLDDWTTKGSWLRFGLQQTPWIDYEEGIYRYRFQGPVFVDREGFLTSSDYAFSGHWNFPGNYGDVHAGFYNGDGYNRVEANDQKAFQVRAAVRPLPLGGTALKGLRFALFYDGDNYLKDAKKQRFIANVTYEHPVVNAGFDYLDAKDRTLPTSAQAHAKGWSAWVTPKLPHNFEILLRHDDLKPNDATNLKRKRDIAGIAYWLPARSGVTTSLLVDYDSLKQDNYSPARPDTTLYGIKLLVNF